MLSNHHEGNKGIQPNSNTWGISIRVVPGLEKDYTLAFRDDVYIHPGCSLLEKLVQISWCELHQPPV